MHYFENENHYVNWFSKIAKDKLKEDLNDGQKDTLRGIWNTRKCIDIQRKYKFKDFPNRVSWEFKEGIKQSIEFNRKLDLSAFFVEKYWILYEYKGLAKGNIKFDQCTHIEDYLVRDVESRMIAFNKWKSDIGYFFSLNNIKEETITILESLVDKSGIYKLYDVNKQLIYIGKSIDLSSRIMVSTKERGAYYFSYIKTKTDADASIIEPYLISIEKPIKNVEFITIDKPSFEIPIPDESEIYDIFKEEGV